MIDGSWVRERGYTMPRLLPRRVRSLHSLVLVLVVALCAWLGWMWYRGSSFVRIEHVTVTGLSGPAVSQIRADLRGEALQMTTLNINIARLDAAVSQYAYVRRLAVTSEGAHGVVIHVYEQVPVATVPVGNQIEVVDGDDQLLSSNTTHGQLPVVPLVAAPGGSVVTAPGARAAIAVLAAAPYALLAHVANATSSSAHGVILQLRDGPQLYFGPSSQLEQKWTAAVAVLQNKNSAGASYIDVTDPQRPAAGTGVSLKQAATLGLASGSGTATTAGQVTSGNTTGG